MYGMIILGILMLIEGATATISITATPSTLAVLNPTNINITLSVNETTVTLSGEGLTATSALTLYSGAGTSVLFTGVTMQAAGVLYVNANSSGDSGYSSIQVGSSRRNRRYLIYSYTPEQAVANAEVTLLVKDKTLDDPTDDIEVDVMLAGKKIAYGVTGDDGKFTFMPTQEGIYDVTLRKSGYYDATFKVTVAGSLVTTTTTLATTTTKAVTTTTEATTTTQATTTTKKTTTTAPTTTTTMPATTTTAAAPAGGIDSGMLLIGLVIVIVLVVVYFVAIKGKGGAKPEAPAEAPKEGA
jgi:hypothetical protein